MQKIAMVAAAGVLLLSLSACTAGSTHLSTAADDKTAASNAAPQKAGKIGSRSNPAPAGSVITVNDMAGDAQYKVTIGKVNLNADAVLKRENMFNKKAPKGSHYLLIPVTFRYIGSEKGTPGYDVTVEYVSADGKTYSSDDNFAVVPHAVSGLNAMYAGAKATGNLAIAVPAATAAKGLLTVSSVFGDPFFVKIS